MSDFEHSESVRALTGDVYGYATNTTRIGSPVQPGMQRFGTGS